MIRHFCASVIIINPENKKILLVKHKKFNKWVQPGGHLENDEFPEEAAVREAYEETNVKVRILGERFPREDDFIRPLAIQKNRGTNDDVHIDFTYLAVPIGNIKASVDLNESYSARWFSRAELDKIDVFQDIKISMDYILNNIIK